MKEKRGWHQGSVIGLTEVLPHCQLYYDPGWKFLKNTGKCYKLNPVKATWTEAAKSCEDATTNPTSTLASVPEETNDFLKTTFVTENTWIGGQKSTVGAWAWSDGSQWTFTKVLLLR